MVHRIHPARRNEKCYYKVALVSFLLAILLFKNSTLRFRIMSALFAIVVVGLLVYPNLVAYRCKSLI